MVTLIFGLLYTVFEITISLCCNETTEEFVYKMECLIERQLLKPVYCDRDTIKNDFSLYNNAMNEITAKFRFNEKGILPTVLALYKKGKPEFFSKKIKYSHIQHIFIWDNFEIKYLKDTLTNCKMLWDTFFKLCESRKHVFVVDKYNDRVIQLTNRPYN